MVEKEVELTLGEIKGLYEYFLDVYRKEGVTVDWSIFVFKSLQMLSKPYEEIYKGEYNEQRDPQYPEYVKKLETLLRQYVDRDEQGNPKYDKNGEPIITEMIVEFQNEKKKLDEEFKDLVERVTKKAEINYKFLSQKVKIKMLKADKNEIPNKIPPIIVNSIIDL
jgi:hypothetical protein